MQAPKPKAGHPQAPALVQQPAVLRSPHLAHEPATHAPPLEEVDDPLEELIDMHAPALHVPPLCVQSVQAAPAVPHTVSTCAEIIWQVLVLSQQPPAQLAALHVPPPLDDEDVDVDDPPSSPEPLEEVVLPLLLP